MNDLIKIAKEKIKNRDESLSQVTVLKTTKNNIYTVINDFDGFVCNELLNNDDTQISIMISMWKTGTIDISSYKFRKALIDLNKKNNDTDIVLKGLNGLNYKKLSSTL